LPQHNTTVRFFLNKLYLSVLEGTEGSIKALVINLQINLTQVNVSWTNTHWQNNFKNVKRISVNFIGS